jgi:acyl carrier protein
MRDEKSAEAVSSAIKSYVQELARDVVDHIDEDTDLIERGVIDSIDLIRLTNFIEERFQIAVRDEDMVASNFRSVRAIQGLVARCQ